MPTRRAVGVEWDCPSKTQLMLSLAYLFPNDEVHPCVIVMVWSSVYFP